MAHGPSSSGDASTPESKYSYMKRVIRLPVYEYIHTEVGGGLILLAAAAAALIWANTSDSYHHILETHLSLDLALFSVDLPIKEWINDALMAIFFFVVALEIKRELLFGRLSTPRRAALPVIAAVGGMAVPVLIYLSINSGGEGMRGWGIPMATDIAFALGILALLGRRAPPELRVLLLGLAVVDDVGAILVIAVAYTDTLSFQYLGLACGLLAAMIAMNRVGFNPAVLMAALAFLAWVAVLNSGVHATVAGVAIGALTPARPRPGKRELVLEAIEALKRYRSEFGAGSRNRVEPVLDAVDELSLVSESTLERLERGDTPMVHLRDPADIRARQRGGTLLGGDAPRRDRKWGDDRRHGGPAHRQGGRDHAVSLGSVPVRARRASANSLVDTRRGRRPAGRGRVHGRHIRDQPRVRPGRSRGEGEDGNTRRVRCWRGLRGTRCCAW